MKFDNEYDVVVVGGGGSGKAAAYVAVTEGKLSACVLEKLPETGGSSRYAEGMCAAESRLQKELVVPRSGAVDQIGNVPYGAHFPTKDELFHRYLAFSHRRANPDVVRAFVENAADSLDMMESIGCTFTDVSVSAIHREDQSYTIHNFDGLGERAQELLLRACVNEGVDIFTNTPAKELIMDGGKVVGVVAEDADGHEMRIGAKTVVIATGGFGQSMDMVRKYSWYKTLPETNMDDPSVPIKNTGDGINMAIAAGADTFNIGTLMTWSVALNKTADSHLTGAGDQPTLFINSKGERFTSEDVVLDFIDYGVVQCQLDDGISYTILDSNLVKLYSEEQGSDIALGYFVIWHKKLERIETEVQASIAAKDGTAFKADSIEELAKQINVPADAFKATVARYNELCENGYDHDYGKVPEYMRSIAKPPFYAIRKAPCILVSDGAIRVNKDMQACNAHYDPIPGLYVVGNDASGMFGDTYSFIHPGTANGFAHTSGRLAARHAIKQIKG
jgi:fumarate reductase flavoprotein subunit